MKILKRLPMIIFTAFIGIMLLLFIILPKQEYSSSEKRYLTAPPELTVKSFFSGEFGEEFENYLSDHTAFRKFFVGLNSYYNYLINNNGENGYYLCKNGYIVNDPTTTEKLDDNINIINDFYKKTAVDTTVLIAPSTGYICEDILPKNHLSYKDDQMFEAFSKGFDKNIHFTDVRQAFKDEYAKGNQLYYKTDHHWTSYGAYTAYTVLADTLKLSAPPKDSYDISSINDFYGTTYSSSGFWLTKPDTLEVWDDHTDAAVKITDGKEIIEQNSCFFKDNLNTDDQYTVFLDGNHPYTEIHNDKAEKSESVLIIKDSFAHSLTPFLAANYSDITMIDMRYYKDEVSALVKEKNFSKIIYIYSADNFATDQDLAWLE